MNVNQNDIRSYLTDIFEGNDNIGLTIQKIQNPVVSGNHNLADTSTTGIKLQITYLTQLFAVLDIYDILAFQL